MIPDLTLPKLSKNKRGEIIFYKDVTATASCSQIPVFPFSTTIELAKFG